jgi:hypothetical protein
MPDVDASGDDDADDSDSAVDSVVDLQLQFATSLRTSTPGTDGVFALDTPRDSARVAGTAVTLAARPEPGPGLLVSRPVAITLNNGPTVSPVDIVEHPRRKEEAVVAHEPPMVVTAQGVVMELTAASLAVDDVLHLAVVDTTAAPEPLPGLAAAPLVAVTLASARTAFNGPVLLRLPYPDEEPDGLVDGLHPAPPVIALTVWRFEAPRGTRVRLPTARVVSDHQSLEVAITETGLYGAFQAADGSLGSAGTSGPALPTRRSAPAQGSGWQDIGVVTTTPFLVPWNTTTLPDGDYEVRVLCATQSADLMAAPGDTGEPAATVVTGRRTGGDGSGCFIATAAYGSPLAPQVQVLRMFRETYLRPWWGGPWLIRLYEIMSPPLAARLRDHAGLRLVVRGALTPIVWTAGLVMEGSGEPLLVQLSGNP